MRHRTGSESGLVVVRSGKGIGTWWSRLRATPATGVGRRVRGDPVRRWTGWEQPPSPRRAREKEGRGKARPDGQAVGGWCGWCCQSRRSGWLEPEPGRPQRRPGPKPRRSAHQYIQPAWRPPKTQGRDGQMRARRSVSAGMPYLQTGRHPRHGWVTQKSGARTHTGRLPPDSM